MSDEPEPRSEIQVGPQEVARFFRLLSCASAQVSPGGDVVWYFDAGLVLRHDGPSFWLSVAPVRP